MTTEKSAPAIENPHNHDHNHDHDHDHDHGAPGHWLQKWDLLLALIILVCLLIIEYGTSVQIDAVWLLAINVFAYLLAGRKVLDLAFRKMLRLDFFNEFFLMSSATIGAFAIGAYSEGVAVMVFYSIGEWFQDTAVDKAKGSIKALLDLRPETVRIHRNDQTELIPVAEATIGQIFQVFPGEKVALDGELISDLAVFNTAALTGESMPANLEKGGKVYAGMVNLQTVAEVRITAEFKESKLSRILEMVQEASARKSETQLFIARFARLYTPIVFALAAMVVTLPYFFVNDYEFQNWLYRGLVFLVISCPCALVVSIPLGYFGGIGLASANGILFKGANFLDLMAQIDHVVMDKTGTLTKGIFTVRKVITNEFDEEELVRLVAALESKSTHPLAQAMARYGSPLSEVSVSNVEEFAGLGLSGMVNGKHVLAGNTTLLRNKGISYDPLIDSQKSTIIAAAVDGTFAGYFIIADEIKDDALETISGLHNLGIKTTMLSGDKTYVVEEVAAALGISDAFGGLMPEDKVSKVGSLKLPGKKIAFVGDGINDAPVLAMADVGIAMGGLGSDAAIETADVVIQNDQPKKILTAIRVGKITRNVVWQNISLAMGVKLIVLILGAGGVATLWEAVIADVGVALLAILNAVRIQRRKL